nr:hypothetical protein BaRGS_027101 [Batillaria attramentaria]
METDNGSIFSQLNGLLFARHGRRKSEVTFPEEGGKSDENENTTSVSLVRMTKLTKEFEERFRFHPISSLPPPEPFSEGKKTYPSLMQKSSGNNAAV